MCFFFKTSKIGNNHFHFDSQTFNVIIFFEEIRF